MKVFCYFLLSAFAFINPLQAQIFSGPNKSVNGLRTGLWVEQGYYTKIDSTGNYHMLFYQHYTPRSVIIEGVYEKSQPIGFWKEFWIEPDSMHFSKRGSIKSLIEYKNGVRDGLFFEFYRNGNLRAMGWNESYPITDTAFTFTIYDSNGKNAKDTTIHVTHNSRMARNGFYFAETDSSSLKFRKLNAD